MNEYWYALVASASGALPFLLYFVPAVLAVLGFMWVYTKLTPYDEVQLIRENNSAASITYVGAMFGFTLPIASVIANAVSLIDFAVWIVIAGAAQLVTFVVFRMFYPKLVERVIAKEISVAIKLAGVSVMVGLLNAAAVTY